MSDRPSPVLQSARLLSAENAALIELGKTLLISSQSVGRDFCKVMVPVSTGAVPLYIGLLKFVLGDKYIPSGAVSILGLGIPVGLLLVTPAVLFLLAGLVFARGVVPEYDEISLDLPRTIEVYHRKYLERSRSIVVVGFGLFALANATAAGMSVLALMNLLPLPPAP